MTLYTVKKSDRRFRLYHLGFQYYLEWPDTDYGFSSNPVWLDYRRVEKLAEQRLNTRYYRYAAPDGRWTTTEQRILHSTSRQPLVRRRLFVRDPKYLTLLQLG